jgi:ATP-dependent exoDNAse (exonuclease V) beta subunit
MKNITFINAGAGSGKTYRLTTDLARKLTQENIAPSQVILTTYTELAAAEFREKARKEILNAKDEDGNLVKADVRIRCATELDNAFIGTVHAISYRFIRKYWYLLDYGADIKTMSDQNQDFYMSQSISEIVNDDDRKVFRDFRDAFDIMEPGSSKPYHLFWLPELKDIVDKMEYYDIGSVGESVRKSQELAQMVFTGMDIPSALTRINEYLPALRSRCEDLTTAKAIKCVKVIKEFYPLKTMSDLMNKDVKECLEETYGKTTDSFYNSNPYLSAMDAYQQVFVSKDFLPVIERYLKTIFDLAVRWQKALTDYKQENHVISFDDMEKIFLTMLTDDRKYGEVQQDIASNFRLLMVDEFQDSNPIQLKIFNRISELIAQNGGHSVWVGDPKQAIYGFRGSDSRFIADILGKFNFSDDGSAIPEQGPEMLGTDQLLESWRSRPKLVEFSNRIFLKPFLAGGGLKEKQIVLKPHFTAEMDTMGDEPALYVWRTEQEKNEPRARMLARKIKDLVKSGRKVHYKECDKETRPVTYRDIAVLCATNSDCNTVASALRKIGVPASCEENHLMQCLEVYLLKTILLFMQNPSDKLLRAELAMLLDDATTEEILKDRIAYVSELGEEGLDRWMDQDSRHPHSEAVAKIDSFTQRYQRLSIYDTVVAIREELDLDNIVEKWGDATQRKHNLSTTVNLAKAYDDMCCQMGLGSSILGFINYLTITKPENKTDNAANTVKVLTYHRSKGLEWPVVILCQLWKDRNDEKDLVKKQFRGVNVFEQDDPSSDVFDRKRHIALFPSGIGGAGDYPVLMESNIVKLLLFKTIKDQAREEALRLLYVGVTRAKDILVSLTSKKPNGDVICAWPLSLGIGEGQSDNPFGDGHGEVMEELTESIYSQEEDEKLQYRQTTNKPAVSKADPLHLSPSTIKSFPKPFTKNVFVDESQERIIDMAIFAGEPNDAVKGTCIHNIFASYRDGDQEGNLKRITATLDNFGFPNRLLEQKEKILESAKWLYEFLISKYGKASRIEKEYPVLYQLPTGQVLRGEMDLLWFYMDKDGKEKCVLVDYKTFPGKRSELEAHTEKYYSQLSAYHAALTEAGIEVSDTFVYYPVQGHLRKLVK